MATDAPSPGEAANALLVPIRTALPWQRIGVWLRRGCSDYRACWPLSSWFGLCFVAMGGLQLLIFREAPAYSMALISGFLLLGPFRSDFNNPRAGPETLSNQHANGDADLVFHSAYPQTLNTAYDLLAATRLHR